MTLYKHQTEGLARLEPFESCALFWDMGLGKTRTAIVKSQQVGDRVLVVCPLSVIVQWQAEIENEGYDSDNLRKVKHPRSRFGVINYDSVWRKNPLLYIDYDTVILDESQSIANDKSKRTKYILKYLTGCRNVILLSGTPDGGHYENLYTQLKALGYNETKGAFYGRFVNTALVEYVPTVKTRIVTGYKNVPELKQLCKDYGCDFLKTEECLELPEQKTIDIQVECTADYRRFKNELVTEIDGHLYVGDSIMAEVVNLRRLASAGKRTAYSDLVSSASGRLVVFYNFMSELDNIRVWNDALNRPTYIVNGAYKEVEDWTRDSLGVLAVQYQAGATGLNLQICDTIIYLSPCYSSNLYEQSKKRIHRIGQSSYCKYYRLIMRDSIEQDIYKTLELRRDYSDKLFLKSV